MIQSPSDALAIVSSHRFKCPVCGKDHFVKAEDFIHLIALPTQKNRPLEFKEEVSPEDIHYYPVTIVSCKYCGYIMMFSTQHDLGED